LKAAKAGTKAKTDIETEIDQDVHVQVSRVCTMEA
jgi:hypothetical protein